MSARVLSTRPLTRTLRWLAPAALGLAVFAALLEPHEVEVTHVSDSTPTADIEADLALTRSAQIPLREGVDVPDEPRLKWVPGKDFKVADEFYRFESYDRKKVRVLLTVDLKASNHNRSRKDRDNPLAWVREFGKGRVFYSAFGQRSSSFENTKMLAHWLAGIQFVLGDIDAATESLPQPEKR